MNLSEVSAMRDRCTGLHDEGRLDQALLYRVLADTVLAPDTLAALLRPDPDRPYGRRVLFANDAVEGMIATWTRDTPCAPHDHGGSFGGVRVLQGEALHQIYAVEEGALRPVKQERVGPGGLLACAPDLVHSMQDGGAADPLVTLHLYSGPIDYMVVYDVAGQRTVIVDGGCGAWLPWDQPELIRAVRPGLLPPAEVAA